MAPFVVYCTGEDSAHLNPAVQSIVGQYSAIKQKNHGKQVFRRSKKPGDSSQVVLYYWDKRDGDGFAGWWIGTEVGGGQVWAHSTASSETPPFQGWRCPVSGPEQPSIICNGGDEAAATTEDAVDSVDDAMDTEPQKEDPPAPIMTVSTKKLPKRHLPERLVAMSRSHIDELPEAVAALLGEFKEQGTNHGRVAYQRVSTELDEPSVWIYYWDERDGRDMSGWWFGGEIGGSDVYARAMQNWTTPPVRGWRVPHDRPVRNDFMLVPAGPEEDKEMSEEQRLEKARTMVTTVELDTDKLIVTSQAVLAPTGDTFEDAIESMVELLEAQLESVEDNKACVVRHSRAARKQKMSGSLEAELSLLQERLDCLGGQVNASLSTAKDRLSAFKAGNEPHARTVEAALPQIVELVEQAELVAKQAETDEAADQARKTISKARTEAENMVESAKDFAPSARRLAEAEFGALLKRCGDAERQLIGKHSKDATPSSAAAALEVPLIQPIEVDLSKTEEALLRESHARLGDLEALASSALGTARGTLRAQKVDLKSAREALALLEDQIASGRKFHRQIGAELCAQRKVPLTIGAKQALTTIIPQLEALTTGMDKALLRSQQRFSECREKAIEEGDVDAARDAMPAAVAAVRKALTAVDGLAAEGEAGGLEAGDGNAERASGIQGAADSAQALLAVARAAIDAQFRASANLGPESAQHLEQLGPMRQQLVQAQKRLLPYRNTQATFESNQRRKVEVDELKARLERAEKEVQRLQTACGTTDDKSMVMVEAAVPKLLRILASLAEVLNQKLSSAGLEAEWMQQLGKLQEKCDSLSLQAQAVRGRAASNRKECAARAVVSSAEEEVAKVDALGERIMTWQNSWTEGLLSPDGEASFEAGDALLAESAPLLETAESVCEKQLGAAAWLPTGAEEAMLRLQSLRRRVDNVRIDLGQLRVDLSHRRTAQQLPEELQQVAAVRKELSAVRKAAAPLAEDVFEKPVTKATKAACKATVAAAKSSAQVLGKARAALMKKQGQPATRNSPSLLSVLTKLQAEVLIAEREIEELRDGADQFEAKQKLFGEQRALLTAWRRDVEKAAADEDKAAQLQEKLNEWKEAVGKFRLPAALGVAASRLLREGAEVQRALQKRPAPSSAAEPKPKVAKLTVS